MNFSTVPPWASTISRTRSKYRPRTAPDHLRIVVVAEGGRADDVGEQDGDELAFFRHAGPATV